MWPLGQRPGDSYDGPGAADGVAVLDAAVDGSDGPSPRPDGQPPKPDGQSPKIDGGQPPDGQPPKPDGQTPKPDGQTPKPDGGTPLGTWQAMSTAGLDTQQDDLNTVWCASANDVYAAGDFGLLARFNGSSWTTQNWSPGVAFEDMWGSGGIVRAVGHSLTIVRFDGGWVSDYTKTSTSTLYGIHGIGADIWATGSSPTLLYHNGMSWKSIGAQVSVSTGTILRAVWAASATEIFIATSQKQVLRLSSGSTTVVCNTGTTDIKDVWGFGPSNVYAVGSGGAIWHYDGNSCTQVHSSGLWLEAIWGSAPDRIFAVGNSGAIVGFDGVGWKTMTPPTGYALKDVWGCGTAVYAVGPYATVIELVP